MTADLAIVAGGGTGGHVFPALAVAEELGGRGWRVEWMGRTEGMEKRLVDERSIPYHGVPARAVVGGGPVGKVLALSTLAVSAVRAWRVIRSRAARVILGTGGYVSAPAMLGARLAGRPAVMLEPNFEAGLANRWLSRWATVAAVGFAETASGLACRSEVTGVPVRRSFHEVPPASPEGRARLLVLGGSQGAQQLNRLVPAALERLAPEIGELEVLHQVGQENVESTRSAYEARSLGGVDIAIEPFLNDVAGEMTRAHLVVSRAGAVTLAEICAAGRPAVLVPLAVAGGHQRANADRLAETGGAVSLGTEEVAPEELGAALGGLLADRRKLVEMGETLRRLARPEAASEIADLMTAAAEAA